MEEDELMEEDTECVNCDAGKEATEQCDYCGQMVCTDCVVLAKESTYWYHLIEDTRYCCEQHAKKAAGDDFD